MLKKMLMQMEQEGEAGGSWLATLPEEIRGNPSLTKFKNHAELAKSYVEAQSLLGSSVRPPSADASAEAKAEFRKKMQEKVPDLIYAPEGDAEAEAAFWKRLGKPEKLEEYDVPAEALEAGYTAEELRTSAAAMGLTKAQFKKMVEGMVAPTLAQRQKISEAVAALKSEWGAAYTEKVTDAKAAALKMGVPEADLAKLSPAQLRVFANVAKATGASAAPFNRDQPGGGRLTPEEAKAEMADIRGNPAYWDDSVNPGKQKALIAKMVELTKMAFPE